MVLITRPDTELMVATLTRCGRRWMLMLWDGQGGFLATQWHKTKREALNQMQAHCKRIGVPCVLEK